MSDRGMMGNTFAGTRYSATHVPSRGMGTYKKRPGTKPILAPYSQPESVDDHRKPELQARLYEESVGFPNLADQPFVVDQAKSAILNSLKDVFNVMEFLRNKWLILYRLYRGETLVQFQYGRAQMHSPEPFKAVETMHPRIMRAIFGSKSFFKLYGEGSTNDVNAAAQEALCQEQFRAMQFRSKQSRFIRDGLIYGTAIQKTYWKQRFEEVRYRTGKRVQSDGPYPATSKVELSDVKQEELVFDGNWCENVSIFDFLTSPNASSVEEAEWMADRSHWASYDVKMMAEMGHWLNLHQLKDHPGTNDLSFGDEFKERKSYAYGVFDPREASFAPHIPHYQIVDWWGPLVVKDDKGHYTERMCNAVMVEPDGPAVVTRVTQNPFWHRQKPYQVWRPIMLEDEMFGIGILEMIARLSMEKDMKRNLLMAATQLEANPMMLLSDDANIPDGQLIMQPGMTFRVPDVERSMKPLHVPQVSDAALKAENILTKDIRETTGTSSPMMGVQDPFSKAKTATQHTSELDESNIRLIGMIENHELEVIEPMLNQMTWNNQQFASYEKVVREAGAIGLRFHDRYSIRPEDLLGRFIVQPLVSHRLSAKTTMTQQLVNILDRAPIINQMYGPNAVKMPQLLAWILDFGFDLRNVEDFIGLPPDEGGLLTAIEEHELWYHGQVPNRRADDNDARHWLAHMQEFKTERFEAMEKADNGTAVRARAHAAEHARKIALMMEQQENALMQAAQMQSVMGGANGGSPVPGAAGPGQDPGSPQVRRNENERGEGGAKSEAMAGAPNPGAS